MDTLIVILSVLCICTAALFGLGYYMFAFVVVRPKPKAKKPETDLVYIQREQNRERDKKALLQREHEDLSVKTHDGLTLRGWFFPGNGSAESAKRFLIFSHGHKCNGIDEFSHIAPLYLDELGYGVLMPDHRAHGRSDGKYIGFSVLDSRDILLWVNYLTKRFGEDIEIVMHGASMGAATILLANQSDALPPQVKLIVEDCGFSSAYEELRYNVKIILKFDAKPVLDVANMFCRLFAGYDFRESDALGNMDKSKRPILFVHGAEDKYVPTYMGQRMYDACTVPKDILLVEKAVHVFSYYEAPELYKAKVREFIENHISLEREYKKPPCL
ncbi:MAG: alpha/beta hydrolase [Oscillospiraceae bacterium]|nr:alpha/beta hydrolase [Oscillospiraceae bacterium]